MGVRRSIPILVSYAVTNIVLKFSVIQCVSTQAGR